METLNKMVYSQPVSAPGGSVEKRSCLRFPFSPAVEVLDLQANTQIKGRLSDISRNGCYIDTINPFGEALNLAGAGSETWLTGAEEMAEDAPPSIVTGTDPAYIMFTSGSTGEPKGAVIPHQGVLSLMEWARKMVGAPARERFTGINPLHFDNSVFDIYCGLLNGAAMSE